MAPAISFAAWCIWLESLTINKGRRTQGFILLWQLSDVNDAVTIGPCGMSFVREATKSMSIIPGEIKQLVNLPEVRAANFAH